MGFGGFKANVFFWGGIFFSLCVWVSFGSVFSFHGFV